VVLRRILNPMGTVGHAIEFCCDKMKHAQTNQAFW
jgi:transcription termination factor Rho